MFQKEQKQEQEQEQEQQLLTFKQLLKGMSEQRCTTHNYRCSGGFMN
jgi:hypothetical protein